MMKAIMSLLLSSVMSVNLWAAESLSDDVLYGKIRERFPELSLPEEQPTTIVHVSSESELTEAVKKENVSGHKVICVNGTITLTIYLSLNIASGNRVTIVGVTQAGDFKYATITGKGILSSSAGQVDIANLYFTNIVRGSTDNNEICGNAISLGEVTGEHRITSVTIDNCSSEVENDRGGAIGAPYLGGVTPLLIYNTTIGENCVTKYKTAAPLYASDARTVSLINCTIIASNGKDKNGNDVKKNVYWLASSSPPKVVTNVLFDQAPTVTIKEESLDTEWTYKIESNLVWVKDGVNLPHYEFATTSAALDTGSEISSVLKYDALGNLRDDGNGTDFGAVEITNPATELRKPIRIIVR